jgi:serine/threonine protein kinase
MTTAPAILTAALGDRYHVENVIGQGGMAVVYRAQDIKHDRPVAIKVMRPEISAALGRERFLSEISIAARLQHPHILPLIDSGDVDGLLYYVMPFLDGETLAQRLTREGRLPISVTVRIATEIASALRYSHERGVLHRDIKPANVMLTGGHAVVMDFGIARAMNDASTRLTATGMIVGTPAYMAPELIEGKVDKRADIYALGCVLYEMLTGAPPFGGPTAQVILLRHLTHRVTAPSSTRNDVPQQFERVVMRALEKKPDDRFEDVPALLAELERPTTDAPPAKAPSPAREPESDAYDTYLRGIHSFEKRTEQGNDRAIELLERATKEDPAFAPAFAALAAAYVEKYFTHDPDPEWEERAFVAIEKARSIDPNLAKIYVVRGNLLWTRERRFPHFDAIDEFRHALEIDPDNAQALNELGRTLFHIGRLDEAVASLERALELDSSFINARFRLALAEMLRGNYAKSIELLRFLPKSSHGSSNTALRALNTHYLGDTEEGRRILASAPDSDRTESDFHGIEAIFFALAGDRDATEKSITAEIEVSRNLGHFHHALCYIAAARALLGESETAIELLAQASEDGFPCYPWFERDPCLESIRGLPRFASLTQELKSRWG